MLSTQHQYPECAGQHRSAWMRTDRSWIWRRSQLRGGYIDSMGFDIESQRVCLWLSLDGFDHAVLIEGVLMDNGHGAVVCAENQTGRWIEGNRVDVRADRQGGDNLSRIRVCDSQNLIATTDKQPVLVTVYRHGRGVVAGGTGWP